MKTNILVVTRPAPESTIMLRPDVVTPKAAKAAGKQAKTLAIKRNLIMVEGGQISANLKASYTYSSTARYGIFFVRKNPT